VGAISDEEERDMATVETPGALGTFHGTDDFPIEWQEGERELFWIYDDLHCPNPVSPLFFDIGGWWLTCDHMFRRFGTPFASDWIAKRINGYVYTAAIPADPSVRAEATEYQARYAPRVPRDGEYAGAIGAYLGFVLPHYAENFLEWWQGRLRPEIERNFAYLDGRDWDGASFAELAVLLEDAIDVHDRHWKIHWMLNFAQFSATMALNAAVEQVRGQADPALLGRLQSSVADRNWDSIEDLWKMKEEIKGDDELRAAFDASDTASGVLQALEGSERGRRFLAERLRPHQQTFGYKSIWSHEFAFKTWVEDPAPIVEAVRGYLATDYDYPANIQAVRDDLEQAKADVMDGVGGEERGQLQAALDRSLAMNPLTPDHHFYIDQGTNARLRLAVIAIGRKLADAGVLADAEDVVFLHYNEVRLLLADQSALGDVQEMVSDRRDEQEDAAERRPPSWVGTATEDALAFPYASLWGFPEKFHAGEPATTGEIKGLAASPGVVEGTARYVTSLDQFDEVDEGDILVCRMTNPAWVVLFTKIHGLVTEAGGTMSHPAVVAREFGIPAVVGTTNAGDRIKTGDRVRVNGTTGVVEILG
jgi:pyruvate,water dikinase